MIIRDLKTPFTDEDIGAGMTVREVAIYDIEASSADDVERALLAAKRRVRCRIVALHRPTFAAADERELQRWLNALAPADVVVLRHDGGANERATTRMLAQALGRFGIPARTAEGLESAAAVVSECLRDGDVVVSLGDDSVGEVSVELARRLW